MHSDRRKNTSPQAQPADVSPDTGLDRGFGQMLQQAAISSELIAELSVERDAGAVSLLEEALLQRWPVEGYGDIIRNPAAGLHALEADYGRFVADAEVLVRDLAQFDIAEVIDIRFPVGGVRLEWSRFEHSDLMLGQLWLAEARMLEWLCDEAARVESLCRLARPYALARTALEMEAATGQTRAAAAASGDLYGYLLKLFGRAWNLKGIRPWAEPQLAGKGMSPLLLAGAAPRLTVGTSVPSQVFRTLGFSARRATAAQLRAVAQLLYDHRRLEPEQYSLLCHAEWLLPATEAALAQDWIERFGELLAELWIRGDRGSWVESTLNLLKRAEAGRLS